MKLKIWMSHKKMSFGYLGRGTGTSTSFFYSLMLCSWHQGERQSLGRSISGASWNGQLEAVGPLVDHRGLAGMLIDTYLQDLDVIGYDTIQYDRI